MKERERWRKLSAEVEENGCFTGLQRSLSIAEASLLLAKESDVERIRLSHPGCALGLRSKGQRDGGAESGFGRTYVVAVLVVSIWVDSEIKSSSQLRTRATERTERTNRTLRKRRESQQPAPSSSES